LSKAAKRKHLDQVASLGCIVCRNLGRGRTPAEVHHIHWGMGKKASDFDTIPLCPYHHRSGPFGEAIHNGAMTFQAKYGTELDLLEQTKILIKKSHLV
jgi:hypothetical protein